MSSAASIAVTCPQEIRALNHKKVTRFYWQDPEYIRIANERIRGEKCHYCEKRKATLAHRDNPDSYKSREEYYNPDNMTPCCLTCHHQYRNGRVICPVCHQHYMPRDAEKCRWCRGMPYAGLKTKQKKSLKHSCGHYLGSQRCQRNGRTFICSRSSKTAPGCDYFQKREAVAKAGCKA
jgi:hypothetical protein